MRRTAVGSAIAIYLVCLMVLAPFVGFLDSSFMPASEKNVSNHVEKEMVIPALDERPLRMSANMVYDSESDRVIFFGGSVVNVQPEFDDTWSYDYNTNTWTNMSPAVQPPVCEWASMAYHSGQDKVVLFGGHVSGYGPSWLNHNQTWVYDYNTNTWTQMSPAIAPPPSCGTMEYDRESDLIILFCQWPNGGLYGVPLAQTWTYDLSTDTWTNVTTSVHPSPRSWLTMAYDSESDLIIAFGGFSTETENQWEIYDDTWTYDANTNTWTEISTVGPSVTGELVYDIESDRLVFFGGCLSMSEYPEDLVSETWNYDTNTETWEMMSNDVKPPKRSRGELVYDSESDRVILFEGLVWSNPIEVLHDCWAYDLNNNLWNNVDWDWQEMTPALSPGLRTGSPLVYDIESDRMVIFSGWPDLHYEGVRYNDTWTYDYNSNTWTNMSPASMPVGRGAHMMAYNQKADVLVMFGGVAGWQGDSDKVLADTWTYNLNTNTWTNMSPASNPTPRVASAMAYDNESDIIVMFGGWMPDWSASHETWLYNLTSNTWTNVTKSDHPEGRFYGSLVYDYKDNRLLLVGGSNWDGICHDIWEYDYGSNTWTEILATNEAPIPAVGWTYDTESELIIAYGGPTDLSEAVFVRETWTFNLTSKQWNDTWSLNNPRERSRQYLAYDIESDRTIMYGGALPDGQQGEAIGDTWAYDYRVNEPILIPPPPENLDVSPDSTCLILTWNPPAESEVFTITGYNIYRGTAPGIYELYAELGNVHTFSDLRVGFGITYYYVAATVATTGESEEFSNSDSGFLDLDPYDDGVYSFIAYGDTRSGGTGVSPIHDDLVSRYLQLSDPELILHTGDLVMHGGEADNWPMYDESIAATRTWDSNLKIYYAVGNHEKYTKDYGPEDEDYSTYLGYVDFSDVVNETEGETELYYSFDWRNIHFIFLNTIDGWVGEDFSCPAAQWNWLISDFEQNDKDCIIVSMHNPSYSVRADRPDRWAQAASIRDTFHDLFVDNGVDIVFSGHDHQYYHTFRDGIEYVVTGGGGAPLYEIDTEAPDWVTEDVGFGDYHYCVCKITRVNNTHSRLSVDVVKMDGTIPDTFSLEFFDPILITTTPTTPTTIPEEFPMIMTLVILGGALAVIIVLVIFFQRKGR